MQNSADNSQRSGKKQRANKQNRNYILLLAYELRISAILHMPGDMGEETKHSEFRYEDGLPKFKRDKFSIL